MRTARDFAVGGVRPYYAPERPRVADPMRRQRIASYLAGGTSVGRTLRTDGVWVWPVRFIDEIRDHGLAPELDFLRYMERCGFLPANPEPDEHLEREARLAARAGPPRQPKRTVTYFVRVDDDYPPESPLSLLRRIQPPERPSGPRARAVEEALWRDLAWHPTHTLSAHHEDYDLREVTEAHAAAVIDRWCAKWHEEQCARTR
jgi:hypothetical protein